MASGIKRGALVTFTADQLGTTWMPGGSRMTPYLVHRDDRGEYVDSLDIEVDWHVIEVRLPEPVKNAYDEMTSVVFCPVHQSMFEVD